MPLTGAMSVAFDTTAVALALSIVLMFSQFLIERVETEVLTAVDAQATEQLAGRFRQLGTGTDPQLNATRRMAEAVIQAMDQMVHRQAEIWQATIDAAHQRWGNLVDSAGAQVEEALAGALSQSIETHATHLARAEENLTQQTRRNLDQLTLALARNAELMATQQDAMSKQGKVMLGAVHAVGQINSLQQSLNDNLRSLAGAKNFEDTVMSLSAAIHLLNTRLGQPEGAHRVELDSARSTSTQDRAA